MNDLLGRYFVETSTPSKHTMQLMFGGWKIHFTILPGTVGGFAWLVLNPVSGTQNAILPF